MAAAAGLSYICFQHAQARLVSYIGTGDKAHSTCVASVNSQYFSQYARGCGAQHDVLLHARLAITALWFVVCIGFGGTRCHFSVRRGVPYIHRMKSSMENRSASVHGGIENLHLTC